jgi:magnesium chelatase family protein
MLEKYCPLSEECQATMESVINRLGLSMRSYFRVIKVARTIADLAGGRPIVPADLLEAAGYRFLDRRDLFDY